MLSCQLRGAVADNMVVKKIKMSREYQVFLECNNIVEKEDVRVEQLNAGDGGIFWFKVYRGKDFLFEYYREESNSRDCFCTIKTKKEKYLIKAHYSGCFLFEYLLDFRMLVNKMKANPHCSAAECINTQKNQTASYIRDHLMLRMGLENIPKKKSINSPIDDVVELCKMVVNDENSYVKMSDGQTYDVYLGKERIFEFEELSSRPRIPSYNIRFNQSTLYLQCDWGSLAAEALAELKELCEKKEYSVIESINIRDEIFGKKTEFIPREQPLATNVQIKEELVKQTPEPVKYEEKNKKRSIIQRICKVKGLFCKKSKEFQK